jgi:hypothetical protein
VAEEVRWHVVFDRSANVDITLSLLKDRLNQNPLTRQHQARVG